MKGTGRESVEEVGDVNKKRKNLLILELSPNLFLERHDHRVWPGDGLDLAQDSRIRPAEAQPCQSFTHNPIASLHVPPSFPSCPALATLSAQMPPPAGSLLDDSGWKCLFSSVKAHSSTLSLLPGSRSQSSASRIFILCLVFSSSTVAKGLIASEYRYHHRRCT